MNSRLFFLSAGTMMVLGSCREAASNAASGARPILEVRQENSLPVGEVQVWNLSSHSLRIELDGSRDVMPPNSSKSYSGLRSEVDVHLWMIDRVANNDLKVAWFNVHPTVVGTKVFVSDPK